MNNQTLARELQKFAKEKGVITKTELSRYFKMKPKNAEKFLKGADYIPGRCKLYFISDVTANILNMKETG